jgi:hypothetical protein
MKIKDGPQDLIRHDSVKRTPCVATPIIPTPKEVCQYSRYGPQHNMKHNADKPTPGVSSIANMSFNTTCNTMLTNRCRASRHLFSYAVTEFRMKRRVSRNALQHDDCIGTISLAKFLNGNTSQSNPVYLELSAVADHFIGGQHTRGPHS